MTIPEIRDAIRLEAEMTLDLALRAKLLEWESHLWRRPPVRRAPPASRPRSDQLDAEVRAYAKDHPTATMHRIGTVFGINPGRISEILAGKRQ